MKSTVIDKDLGYKKIMESIKSIAANSPAVTVGIHAKEGSESHAKTELTNVQLGTIHEYGLGVPERSFIRQTFDMNRDKYQKALDGAARGVSSGKASVVEGLKALGMFIVSTMQERIEKNSPQFKELAEVTKKRKGSSKPLIDTGQLKNSITYVVNAK